MNNQDNTVFLKDILDCIAKIERYLLEYDFQKFKNDELVLDAVVRNVEVIGEASNNLTQDFRSKNPQIEWRQIIDTRIRIVHGYATVDMEIIWSIAQNSLPKLKIEVKKILESLK